MSAHDTGNSLTRRQSLRFAGALTLINTGSGILNAGGGILADSSGGATAVTGTDLPADQVYQTAGFGNTAVIPVAATWTGTPSTPMAAVVTPGTYTPAGGTSWQNIPGGSGSITVPAGGPYSLAFQDVATGVRWRSTQNIFVGQCWGVYGQSNSLYWTYNQNSYLPLIAYNPLARRQIGGGWFPVAGGAAGDTTIYPPATWNQGQPGETDSHNSQATGVFANQLIAGSGGKPVGLHWAGYNGVPASNYDPATGADWNLIVGNGSATGYWNGPAYAFDLRGIIRIQGENDASSTITISQFGGRLTNELNGWKAKTNRYDGSFRMGIVLLGPDDASYGTVGNFGLMRAAMIAWIDANASNGAFMAANAIDVGLRDNIVHYADVHEARLSCRYALTALIASGFPVSGSTGAFVTGAGPRITGYTRSGATITASFAMDGATGFVTGDGGTTGAGLGGFEAFTSGGGSVAIASTAFAGTTIVLTFSDAPTAATVATIKHQMQNEPYGMGGYNSGASPVTPGMPVASSIPYGNNIVPGDTIGLPIWPHAAMTVT